MLTDKCQIRKPMKPPLGTYKKTCGRGGKKLIVDFKPTVSTFWICSHVATFAVPLSYVQAELHSSGLLLIGSALFLEGMAASLQHARIPLFRVATPPTFDGDLKAWTNTADALEAARMNVAEKCFNPGYKTFVIQSISDSDLHAFASTDFEQRCIQWGLNNTFLILEETNVWLIVLICRILYM